MCIVAWLSYDQLIETTTKLKPQRMPKPEIEIRPSQPEDTPTLRDIYNHYIEQSHATFDLEPKPLGERSAWLASFNTPQHRCFSAVGTSGTLLGYACSSEFKAKPAYASSVEVSVYIAPTNRQQGIGQQLYQHLLPRLDSAGVHRCYAGIALPNAGSIRLHQQHGFHEIAHLSEVGHKFDRYWDVIWMQRCPPATQSKR
jgi:phosphinothricin acetyltransferase